MGMNWGEGRMTLQMAESCEGKATSTPQLQGLAGWVMALLRGVRGQRETQRKLHVVETLSLGGKRQLMLVTMAAKDEICR
jgi:hypothetical protein